MQAQDGGGIYVEDCVGVTVTSGRPGGNSASLFGGGAAFKHSMALVDGVEFSRELIAVIGGGLSVMDTSIGRRVGIVVCIEHGHARRRRLRGRRSVLCQAHALCPQQRGELWGGAVGGQLPIRRDQRQHSRRQHIRGRCGHIVAGFGDRRVRTTSSSNSTGTGVSCTGSPVPTLSYNLVWNNTGGNYSGCAPGDGSLSANPLFVDPAGGDYHLATPFAGDRCGPARNCVRRPRRIAGRHGDLRLACVRRWISRRIRRILARRRAAARFSSRGIVTPRATSQITRSTETRRRVSSRRWRTS